jgi:two-component system OmpR family sensor kinase
LTDDFLVEPAELAPPSTPDAATTPRRWRFGPRTLTARLVVGVGVLVIIVVVLSGAATYAALRPYLTSQVDSELSASAARNMNFLQRCTVAQTATGTPDVKCAITDPLGPRGDSQWIQIVDANGTQVLVSIESDTYKVLKLSTADAVKFADDQTRVATVTADGTSLRATSRPLRGTELFVVTGVSSESETNTLHRLLLLELIVGGAAVLLALIATAVGVRYSLRPLRNVSDTARAVTAELSPEGAGLDRRVPVTAAEEGTEAGQLAESMNTLLEAVETQFAARIENEQRMRQFLADASHELRTPLTSIRGYAELSRMRRASGRGEVQDDAETLERIETEGNRMSRLVEDLLMLARGDQSAELHLSEVDMGAVVEDAVIGARAAFPDRPIDVELRSSAIVYGDHDQLLRVVRNLINNACVHTAAGGPVKVTVWRQSSVVVQVIDTGPGLPPEQAAQVFERFWRADSSRARSSGGSGLGLSIVASIVAAHGGTIRFDTDVSTGSTMTVTLPPADPGDPT